MMAALEAEAQVEEASATDAQVAEVQVEVV